MKFIKLFENLNESISLINAIEERDGNTKGNYQSVVDAINKGADVNFIDNGTTPADTLIEQQINYSGRYVDWKKSNLVKIAEILVKNNAKFKDSDIIELLKNQAPDWDEIKNAGKIAILIIPSVDINYQDENDRNALMWAIEADSSHSYESNRFYNIPVIKKLIENGIDLLQKDKYGNDFMDCTTYHHKKMAKKLKEKLESILLKNQEKENVNEWFLHENAKKYNL